jgi:hypothetical protein
MNLQVRPQRFEFESDHIQTASKVRHHFVDVKHVGTISALVSFLKIRRPYLCLVFASKKETVKEVYDGLKSNNFDALYFSGNLDDRSRRKALREIKANRYSSSFAATFWLGEWTFRMSAMSSRSTCRSTSNFIITGRAGRVALAKMAIPGYFIMPTPRSGRKTSRQWR